MSWKRFSNHVDAFETLKISVSPRREPYFSKKNIFLICSILCCSWPVLGALLASFWRSWGGLGGILGHLGPGQGRSSKVRSSQVRSGQIRSGQARSVQVSGARAARRKILTTLDWVTRFLWYLARAARRKFCFCNPSARSAEKNFATLDQVTRFLWYLEMLGQHWVSADGKKHEGRAIHLQKTQW